MDLKGAMSMSPNGNVVLRPRIGEATEVWTRADGDGGQSRWSLYIPPASSSLKRQQAVALRPSKRPGIYEREGHDFDGRTDDGEKWSARVVMYPRRRSDSRSRQDEMPRSIYVEKEAARSAPNLASPQSDDCYEVPPGRRGRSESHSSDGGAAAERSVSPVSVGSSVLDAEADEPSGKSAQPRAAEVALGAHRTMKSSGQAIKRGRKKVRRRVAKVPSAPRTSLTPPRMSPQTSGRQSPRTAPSATLAALPTPPPPPKPAQPAVQPTLQLTASRTSRRHSGPKLQAAPRNVAPVDPVVPVTPKGSKPEGRVRKRRRTIAPVQEVAPQRVAPPPRRTAAKSLAAPPPGLGTESADVLSIELTKAEQEELKESVVSHVRKTVQADDDEPDILAEFVCVLLDRRKSSPEMLEELSVMDEEAQPLVTWLQKEKAGILARRPRAAAKVQARHGQAPPDKPPGQFTPLPPRNHAMLTPNAVTTSLEESSKVGDRSQDKGLVVITSRLILQPNSGHRQPEVVDCERSPQGPPPVSAAEKKAEEAYQKKMDLLADMTKELQVILQRLSDKNLCDSMREKYQSLAQTIQNRMSSLSRPFGAEKAEKAYAQAATGNSPPLSPAAPPVAPVPPLPGAPGAASQAVPAPAPPEAVPS